jgi:hypothetical protein
MSLEKYVKNVEKVLKDGDNATLSVLQKVVLEGLKEAHNKLKEEKLTIKLKHNGEKEYKVYPFDSLLMLKFKHRIESKLKNKTDLDELDNAKIFMHLPDGKMIEVAEFDIFEQLIKKHEEPSYFSFEVKNIEEITTKLQAKVRGNQIRKQEDPNGECKGTNPKCPDVDKRIKSKKMSNKARRSICNSYANCKWEKDMLGGRKKKRRKNKKAFPSRKKTHRKNSTKKRARK